jgi:hypothetical protein
MLPPPQLLHACAFDDSSTLYNAITTPNPAPFKLPIQNGKKCIDAKASVSYCSRVAQMRAVTLPGGRNEHGHGLLCPLPQRCCTTTSTNSSNGIASSLARPTRNTRTQVRSTPSPILLLLCCTAQRLPTYSAATSMQQHKYAVPAQHAACPCVIIHLCSAAIMHTPQKNVTRLCRTAVLLLSVV